MLNPGIRRYTLFSHVEIGTTSSPMIVNDEMRQQLFPYEELRKRFFQQLLDRLLK